MSLNQSDQVKAIHCLCHYVKNPETGIMKPQNLFRKERLGDYDSGFWMIDLEEAKTLVWLYLHRAGAERSYFASKITSVKLDPNDSNKVVFGVTKLPQIGPQRWRGDPPGQNPRHYYRIVNAEYDHEKE